MVVTPPGAVGLSSRDLDRRIRIERPVADDAFDGAGAGSWSVVAEVWAQVQDLRPSRGDRPADGIDVRLRPARIRMRFRDDITPGVRIVFGGRVMRILTGPAKLGRRAWLELVAGDYSTAGNGA